MIHSLLSEAVGWLFVANALNVMTMAKLGNESESWHNQPGYSVHSKGFEFLLSTKELARFASNSFGQEASNFPNNQMLLNTL